MRSTASLKNRRGDLGGAWSSGSLRGKGRGRGWERSSGRSLCPSALSDLFPSLQPGMAELLESQVLDEYQRLAKNLELVSSRCPPL